MEQVEKVRTAGGQQLTMITEYLEYLPKISICKIFEKDHMNFSVTDWCTSRSVCFLQFLPWEFRNESFVDIFEKDKI